MGITSIILDPIKNVLLLRRPGQSPLSLPNLDGLPPTVKNYFINGGFDFAQRSTATIASPINTVAYNTVDRWRNAYFSGTWTTAPLVKREIASPNSKTKHSFRWQSNASVGTSVTLDSQQRIEAHLARELLAAGTFSISVWVASQSCTTLRCELLYASAEDNFATSPSYHTVDKTIVNNGAWQLVKFEGLPTNANMVNGLQVRLDFTNYAVLNANADHYLAQAMCNVGPKAQDFVRHAPSLAGELAACQRYYSKSYSPDVVPGTSTTAGLMVVTTRAITAAATNEASVRHPVVMRNSAVLTLYPQTGSPTGQLNNSGGATTPATAAAGSNGDAGFTVSITGGSGFTVGQAITVFGHYTADIDL